ncbi:ring-cleaving dioxygenase [Tenericutes bacterium MZ-XQ]|jgi:glyoxalase family protein|nr:ring-cleaving dioxygenase [Tenericutes bacterium MZ-XQ]
MNNLKGIHHVTAITSDAKKIYDFFTYTLGLRLVKKTVNQDDIQTYHLFFADDKGSPGTDMTFFDFKGVSKGREGTNSISRTSFRVPTDLALEYWIKRFEMYEIKNNGIEVLFDRKVIYFEDFDGQQYALFSDQNDKGIPSGTPWQKGPIPNEFALTGLGPIFLNTSDNNYMHQVLVDMMFMRNVSSQENLTLYEMGDGGNGASVIVKHTPDMSYGTQGYGSVHHVAFRIEDLDELYEWVDHLDMLGARHSGYVDRFYFKSLYTRLHPGILFEFATEGPGFIDDEEDYETLGETLALPPKFRNQRAYVESVVEPIDTIRSDKIFKKEYL